MNQQQQKSCIGNLHESGAYLYARLRVSKSRRSRELWDDSMRILASLSAATYLRYMINHENWVQEFVEFGKRQSMYSRHFTIQRDNRVENDSIFSYVSVFCHISRTNNALARPAYKSWLWREARLPYWLADESSHSSECWTSFERQREIMQITYVLN